MTAVAIQPSVFSHDLRANSPITSRREAFGRGRGQPLDGNARARLMHLARGLMRRTEPGKHYGQITAKALAILTALLWDLPQRHGRPMLPILG